MPCVWIVWIGGVNNTFWWHITNLHIIKSDLLILWIQIWGKNFHALKQSYYIYIYIYIYNFLTRINIFTAIKFGKIASSFSLPMSNFWIFYGSFVFRGLLLCYAHFPPWNWGIKYSTGLIWIRNWDWDQFSSIRPLFFILHILYI